MPSSSSGKPAAAMDPAGGGDEMAGGLGGLAVPCAVDPVAVDCGAGQNIGAESRSRKRNATVVVIGSNNLAGNGDWQVACEEDSQRISIGIEDLRPQLDEDIKELWLL
uniref:Uncharacterized protein n=1 Tax=Arundo donax TaxID=35708 RepID=A0A0A9ADJ1_ARUDO